MFLLSKSPNYTHTSHVCPKCLVLKHAGYTSLWRKMRDEIVCTLQSLGVLGFVDFDAETTTSELDNCCSASLSGECFPIPPSSSLRDATARMGPHVGCNRFLSRLDARISVDLLRNGQKETHIALRDRADSFEDGTPILEHLKDVFLTRRIFFVSESPKTGHGVPSLSDMAPNSERSGPLAATVSVEIQNYARGRCASQLNMLKSEVVIYVERECSRLEEVICRQMVGRKAIAVEF